MKSYSAVISLMLIYTAVAMAAPASSSEPPATAVNAGAMQREGNTKQSGQTADQVLSKEIGSISGSLNQIASSDKSSKWNSLEIVKLLVSVMTPLAVFLLGWFVNSRLRKLEKEEGERRRVAEEQQQQQLRILEEQRLKIERELHLIQQQQVRLANRNEFQRLTLEINKQIIRDPSLDAFNQPEIESRKPDQVKLEALAYIYLNMFELVYEYYHPSEELTKREEEEWRVWDETIRSKLTESRVLRIVIEKEDSPRIYYGDFFDYIRKVLRNVPSSPCTGNPPGEERPTQALKRTPAGAA